MIVAGDSGGGFAGKDTALRWKHRFRHLFFETYFSSYGISRYRLSAMFAVIRLAANIATDEPFHRALERCPAEAC